MSCGIYKFKNKVNNKIYIGQSSNLQQRYEKHIKNIKDLSKNEIIYKAFRKYGIENFEYSILKEFEYFDQKLLNDLEIYYIEYYNSLIPNGYNMVPGGSNGAGLAKGKKVELYDLKGNFIKSYNSAHLAELDTKINFSSICACARGDILHTKNFQWKYSNDSKIIKNIEKEIILKERPVCKYDENYILLEEYKSLSEAHQKNPEINKSSICNVCNGKKYSAGGYIWRYKDNFFIRKKQYYNNNTKKVLQLDKNGNIIEEYSSIMEASKKTGINRGNISSVCTGSRKTAGKYFWKFKEEEEEEEKKEKEEN